MVMRAFEKIFLDHLLASGALKFGRFRLKSGRISSYFINLGAAMATGKGASLIAEAYTSKILADLGLSFDYIHGPAYKGIPIAALVSARLYELEGVDKRWGYDRKEMKDHGDRADEWFVGGINRGDRVLMLDDVLSDGGTKVELFRRLIELGLEPVAVIVGVDRREIKDENRKWLDEMGVRVLSILSVEDLLEHAKSEKA